MYYKAIIIKTAEYWYKPEHRDQWNKVESAELNPNIYDQLIFNMGAKIIQCRKYSLFSKLYLENWIATWKRMEIDLLSKQYRKKIIQNGS